jgi:2-C-methyl-D-erythritol 4-phosphate cytidylyltransferase
MTCARLLDALSRGRMRRRGAGGAHRRYRETRKRRGVETVDRQGLWRALDAAGLQVSQLREALQKAARAGITVTDEAQALERMGVRAALVPGRRSTSR